MTAIAPLTYEVFHTRHAGCGASKIGLNSLKEKDCEPTHSQFGTLITTKKGYRK
jgi:hypothetical protein